MGMTAPSRGSLSGLVLPPRPALGLLPTPLTGTRRLGEHLGIDLLVKRDDLIGFAQAGTKTRALEFLVGDARHRGCDCLVGCGGLGSNFLPGLVAAGRVVGLDVHLVVFGDPPRGPDANLAMAQAWGATVRFTGDPDRDEVESAALAYGDELAAAGRRPYVLPRGGATPVGLTGAVAAVAELDAGLDGVAPARIVVAAGSGATAAGLAVGIAARGWPTKVTAAVVSRPLEITRAVINDLAARGARRLETPCPSADTFELIDAIGPGFHQAGPADEAAADLALATEGLLLDPAYTAKAMAVLVDLSGRGAAPGTTVFWHSGGLIGAVSGLMARTAPREREHG